MKKISVIIADDHELFRKGLELILKNIHSVGKIRHAENGQEVIDLLQREKCDVVFMDLRMPVMDGQKATEYINQHFKDVKVICLSSMDDKKSIVGIFRSGACAYLFKNTNKREIEDAIHAVMEGKKFYTRDVSSIVIDSVLDPDKPQKSVNTVEVNLSEREKEILRLICQQFSSKEIADMIGIAEKTINNYRAQLLEKTNSRNMVGLVYYSLKNDIITPL